MANSEPVPPIIHVYFVLLPDSLILDWAGPAEALRIANRLSPTPRFAMHFVGVAEQTGSSVGAQLCQLEPLPASFADPAWLVLVGQPGAEVDVQTAPMQTVLHWLRGLRLRSGVLELVTVCAGSVIAAHAGLLSGKRATTHHEHLEELRQIDARCEVLSNRVLVEDAPVYSSAGVTTGLDLFLHRIQAVCGAPLAAQVAQSMVVPLRRGPHDPELSPFLAYRNHLHPALHRVQDAVGQSPQADWTLPAMAEIAHTSTRHLNRLFVEYAHIAPLDYVRRIRLAVAQTALQSGKNVTQAAEMAGFHSDTQLRRAWQCFKLEGTPSKRGTT